MIKNQSIKLLQIALLLCIILQFSCTNSSQNTNTYETNTSETIDQNVVEVLTTGMNFQLQKEIPSGWTTFRYVNKSEEPHFFVFEKMPEGVGIKAYKEELIPVFVAAFEFFKNGDMDAGMKEFEKIPAWFAEVELHGGVGLTSPNSTTETTVFLKPGTYVMECYVRMPNGVAHTFMGMLEELTVKEVENDMPMPISDYEISVSSEKGVAFKDSIKAGEYTLSVLFEDQQQYESMMGHDVNLVKLEDTNLLDTLNSWINAADMAALRSPAPAGLSFLGGVEDLPSGSKGFFKVSLEQGNYVLISEIPNAVERNMYKQFTVY